MTMTTPDMNVGQPAAKRGRGRRLIGCIAIFVVLGCVLFGAVGYLVVQANGQVEAGQEALAAGDCQTGWPTLTKPAAVRGRRTK